MNGIYSNSELIGTIINDLNEMQKQQAAGQYIQATTIFVGIVQKLLKLRETIDNDLKNRDKTIEQLKEELRACGREVIDIPAEKFIEGEGNGK